MMTNKNVGHNNLFDDRDPISQHWIQTKKVKIYDTNWVPDIERTVYYRPTVGNCSCKQNWTAEKYLLLNTSKNKVGSPCHLVTYNLLIDFSWNFAKAKSSQRFFYMLTTIG